MDQLPFKLCGSFIEHPCVEITFNHRVTLPEKIESLVHGWLACWISKQPIHNSSGVKEGFPLLDNVGLASHHVLEMLDTASKILGSGAEWTIHTIWIHTIWRVPLRLRYRSDSHNRSNQSYFFKDPLSKKLPCSLVSKETLLDFLHLTTRGRNRTDIEQQNLKSITGVPWASCLTDFG